MQDVELQPEGSRRSLLFLRVRLGEMGTGRIYEQAHGGSRGDQFVQQLQPLRPYHDVPPGHARDVAAWPILIGDKSKLDGVEPYVKDDRNCRSSRLSRQSPAGAGWHGNHLHLKANELIC